MAAVDHPSMAELIEDGSLQSRLLIERSIDLDEAAALLPDSDQTPVAGIAVVGAARCPANPSAATAWTSDS